MGKSFRKIHFILRLPRFPVLLVIRVYMSTLSPDHGLLGRLFPQGYCRFWPSCSTYGYQAVEKYGIFRGIWLASRRILRCNPWNKGGVDELK